MRFGLRGVDVDEIRSLASTWSFLNDGQTPAEAALQAMQDRR
jgi:hypothetical protein